MIPCPLRSFAPRRRRADRISRRGFLGTLALGAAATALGQTTAPRIPAIDTHTHFYDPRRSQGVPWPAKDNALLYRPHLPADVRALAEPLGVVGTVIVEASAWLEDNQWILDLAKDEPFIVGFIGRLEAGTPEFAAQLARFATNPLFRGIRLNAKLLTGGLTMPAFVDDLRRLADRGLTLDVVGGAESLDAGLRACAVAPGLRVVLDHLPFNAWDEDLEKARAALAAVAGVPLLYAKISNVLRQRAALPIEDAAVYAPRLDLIWNAFGAQRVVFGSNWPVSNRQGPYALVHRVVAEYFAAKGPEAAAQYFWKNSHAAYGWVPRGAAAELLRAR